MQTTFITIHDLSDDAYILYSSDSIVDILGYTPDEVVNRPTWDFFDPAALNSARMMQQRSVRLDKASVLAYCDIRNREGTLVRCECCFSVVYNVMVACVSLYNQGQTGLRRKADAPIMRRLFASSPADPRYHMLQHLSTRFNQDASEQVNEPRAALFLNRFTRSLAIMYATSGIDKIIGIAGEDMKGRSFYSCIAEACLHEAVTCLETAKSNDSLAYLRFMFRDPRQDDEYPDEGDIDTERTRSSQTSDTDMTDVGEMNEHDTPMYHNIHTDGSTPRSRGVSAPLSNGNRNFESIFIELEAIISCTSDGLVVCLRRARTPVPEAIHNTGRFQEPQSQYTGYFAAPWGPTPVYHPAAPDGLDVGKYPGMSDAPSDPRYLAPNSTTPAHEYTSDQAFLQAIQECGVFAWALVGINGSMIERAHGEPTGDAVPQEGPAVWAPGLSNETTGADAAHR